MELEKRRQLMSKAYYRTPQMSSGRGFRCYNCNQEMAISLTGTHYEVVLICRRCKAVVTIKCGEPIPFVAQKMLEEHNVTQT